LGNISATVLCVPKLMFCYGCYLCNPCSLQLRTIIPTEVLAEILPHRGDLRHITTTQGGAEEDITRTIGTKPHQG